MDDRRKRRLAQNEALARRINDRIEYQRPRVAVLLGVEVVAPDADTRNSGGVCTLDVVGCVSDDDRLCWGQRLSVDHGGSLERDARQRTPV